MRTALGEFAADLAQASGRLDADRRRAWIEATMAVWSFLDKLDHADSNRLRVPFATLASALDGLDDGTVDPALRPAKRRGRAPDPADHLATRAVAAACMDFLMEAGAKKDAAGLFVARELLKQGFSIGKRGNDTIKKAASTIAGWRNGLMEGSDQAKAVKLYKTLKVKHRYPGGRPIADIEREIPDILAEALAGRLRQKSN